MDPAKDVDATLVAGTYKEGFVVLFASSPEILLSGESETCSSVGMVVLKTLRIEDCRCNENSNENGGRERDFSTVIFKLFEMKTK